MHHEVDKKMITSSSSSHEENFYEKYFVGIAEAIVKTFKQATAKISALNLLVK